MLDIFLLPLMIAAPFFVAVGLLLFASTVLALIVFAMFIPFILIGHAASLVMLPFRVLSWTMGMLAKRAS